MADEIITTSLVDESDIGGVETIKEWNPAEITESSNKTNGKFLQWIHQSFWKIKNSMCNLKEFFLNTSAFEIRDDEGSLIYEDGSYNYSDGLILPENKNRLTLYYKSDKDYKKTDNTGKILIGKIYIPQEVKRSFSRVILNFVFNINSITVPTNGSYVDAGLNSEISIESTDGHIKFTGSKKSRVGKSNGNLLSVPENQKVNVKLNFWEMKDYLDEYLDVYATLGYETSDSWMNIHVEYDYNVCIESKQPVKYASL